MKHTAKLLPLLFLVLGCGGHDYHPYSREEIMRVYANGYVDGHNATVKIAHSHLNFYKQDDNYEWWTIDYASIDSAQRIDSILAEHKWFFK